MTNLEIFRKIDNSRTAQIIIREIETLILRGVLRNGDRLPAERDLATQFGVSRPILRDALKDLEARQLLTTRQGGGTYVADVVGSLFSPPLEALIRAHPVVRTDFLDFRREMEVMAASFAAERATDDDLEMLQTIFQRMEQVSTHSDFLEEARIDLEFHLTIADCSHNLFLIHTLRSCYQLLAEDVVFNRRQIYALPHAGEELLERHRALYQAIQAGNVEAARAAAHGHMDYIIESISLIDNLDQREENARLRKARARVDKA